MSVLPVGAAARVSVPATSANLGCGFDCMGIALDWRDTLAIDVLDEGLAFELTGLGAEDVPRSEQHLVVRMVRRGLAELGVQAPGLRLRTHTTIPLSRGLGSSAAVIVAGLSLAWALARPDEALDLGWLDRLATEVEGHPDNVTAAVHGGAVLAWPAGDEVRVVELPLAQGLSAVVFVPEFKVPTADARRVLPHQVPLHDAVRQAARSALLVEALTRSPQHLMEATQDVLHQPFRGPLMPSSQALVAELREAGVPAMVSGAGPTVLALGTREQLAAVDSVALPGHHRHDLSIGAGVAIERVDAP